MKTWVKFVKWHEQAYPRSSSAELHNRVLEDCIEGLIDLPSLRGNARFFKQVLKRYMDRNPDQALAIFGFLEQRRFFQLVAEFYAGWALAAEVEERFQEADRVYQLGIDRHAQPRQLLVDKREQFRMRTVGLKDGGRTGFV